MSKQEQHNRGPDKSLLNDDVVIVSAVRTPLCRAGKGKLASIPPSTLVSVVLRGCLQSAKIPSEDIQDICIGNVLGKPIEFASMRMAQIAAGIPSSVPMNMVNRQCSSGLQAIHNIASAIQCGSIQIGIAAGVESMSANPMSTTSDTPPFQADWDTMKQYPEAMDCLLPMGITSENVAKEYSLQRSDLDEFAYQSHQKAYRAQLAGKFRNEIVPVGNVTEDDGIRPSTTREGLAKLRPVFLKETGLTTAGNSSPLTDGAAAILLMTRSEARRRNLPVMGVWEGYTVVGVPPKIMGIGPAVSVESNEKKKKKQNRN